MIFKPETDEERHERLEKDHEELKKKHDWICYASKFRQFLLFVFGTMRWARYSYISFEDTTCNVHCYCGDDVFINSEWITWCSTCGRGYSTLFEVIQYPAWLKRKNER